MDLAGGREARKAAIGAGDHIFSPDDAGKARDALRDGFGMLDQIGGMGDDTGDQRLAFRQLDVFPDPPLVLVPRVGRLERIGAGLYAAA